LTANAGEGRELPAEHKFHISEFRVAQIVRKRMRTTRKEVAAASYLSSADEAVKRLVAADVLASHAPSPRPWRGAGTGRPSQWLTLSPKLGYLLGVDIAHDVVSATITRAEFGRVLERAIRREVPDLDDDPDAALAVAAELITEVIELAGVQTGEIIGIGVGLPAPVNRATRRVESDLNILSSWSETAPADELAENLGPALDGIPIEVDNDASLGALGVHAWETLNAPPAEAPRDLIYVRVSDGIGAGVVIKGKLVGGGSGFAGEIGHVKVDDRGRFCRRCGQRGCVETKSSDRAVIAEVAMPAFGREVADVSIEEILAHEHPACHRALHEAGFHLGVALAHARTLLDPKRIYIGGPLATSGRFFLPGVRRGILENSLSLATKVADLVVPAPLALATQRPDLESPELFGAIAIALHRCGDEYVRQRLGIPPTA
jgi:predicted NBD/HSP70 family sugar kinase